MNTQGWRWVAVVLVAGCTVATAVEVPLGARLSAVEEPQARGLAGFATRGVAVEEVQPGGLLELLRVPVGSVIVEVNAVRTQRPEDITRAARPLDDHNTITWWAGGRRWTVEVSAPQAKKLAAVIPPDEIDDPDSAWKTVLKGSGLAVDVMPTVPANLNDYAAVMIAHEQVASPPVADDLERYLQKGNGVVLYGRVPLRLCGNEDGYGDLDGIAGWFGVRWISNTREYGRVGGNSRLVLRANKPFMSALTPGQQVFGYEGNRDYATTLADRLGPRAVAAAEWVSPDGARREIGVFYNRYGEGRVAYFPVHFGVDYPTIAELFAAGLRWAARAVD